MIGRVGGGVPVSRLGERVWCSGAQSPTPFGTAVAFGENLTTDTEA